MLTDSHGRANQSYALWEQRISSKAWAFSVLVVPPFFSLSSHRVPPFSRRVIFTLARASLAPLSLRKKDYSKSNVGYHLRQNEENVTWVMCHVFLFFRGPCCFKRYFANWTFDSWLEVGALKGFFDLWYRQQQHHKQHNIIERLN